MNFSLDYFDDFGYGLDVFDGLYDFRFMTYVGPGTRSNFDILIRVVIIVTGSISGIVASRVFLLI